jgi:hypothetical protein
LGVLKVVGNEKQGGSGVWLLLEYGAGPWRSMSVYFLCSRRLFFNLFPFPVCKDQLIGDWYENRLGAPNTIISLIIRQYYWRTDIPCANSNGGPNTEKKLLAFRAWSALPIGGGGHQCANILAHRCPSPPIGKADQTL